MISVLVKTDGIDVIDSVTHDKTNINEVGVVVYRLEQAKNQLMALKFENKLEVSKDGD